jgi:flagellar biosynthesis/type III secretory pathway protein FliH
MKRLFLLPALGVAAFALSAQVQAQQLGGLPEVHAAYTDDRQPYYEARRGAYDNGYREGLKEGERDGRRRDAYRYQDNRTWQRGDKGYNRSFGDFERYRQQFRAGFAEGYQAGYSRYGYAGGTYGNGRAVPRQDPYQYPGGYGYPDRNRYPDPYYGNQGPYNSGRYGYSPAYQNGLSDGIEKGREDVRKHRSFDPRRHDWYRDGDRHYRGEYGSRELYKDAYRRAFQEGYDRGYRELGYYR